MARKSKQATRREADTATGASPQTAIRKKKSTTIRKAPFERQPVSRHGAPGPPSAPSRQAIVVLGMHRSGTSALTRVLSLCGAALPRNLMGPVANNNELGFWESARIWKVHERLLADIGSSWDDVADVTASFQGSRLADRYRHEIGELLSEEYGDAPLFVVKDPRICRFVPFWVDILRQIPAEATFVLPIRNPLEVALSLQARDGMTINSGLLLWLRHFISAERDSRGFPRTLCRFEDLLNDWRAVIERISADLGIAFPRLSTLAGAEIDDFLTDAARHQRKDDEQVLARRDVLGWVKTAYRWALEAAATGVCPSSEILDALDQHLAAAHSAFGPIVASERVKGRQAAHRATGLEAEIQTLQANLKSKDSEGARLQSELRAIQDRLAQSAEETNRLSRQLEYRDEELTTLMKWSRTVVRWAAETIIGPASASPQFGKALQLLSTAPAAEIPQLAFEAIQLAERDSPQRRREEAEEAARQSVAKALEERDGARAEAEALRAERDAAVDAARVAAAARQAALCDRDAALAERDAARSQAEFCRNECDAAMAADAAARAQGMELERLLKTALAEREAQVAELEKSLSDVREITIQRDAAVAELVRTQEIIGNQEDQIANLDAERLKIAEALTDLRKERDDLRAGTESLAARLKDSQEVAVRLQQQLDGLNAQGRRYNNELNSLEQDLKAKRLAIEERDALVVIQRQELERIKSSATWRLSRPFRALAGIGEVAGRKKRRSPGSSS